MRLAAYILWHAQWRHGRSWDETKYRPSDSCFTHYPHYWASKYGESNKLVVHPGGSLRLTLDLWENSMLGYTKMASFQDFFKFSSSFAEIVYSMIKKFDRYDATDRQQECLHKLRKMCEFFGCFKTPCSLHVASLHISRLFCEEPKTFLSLHLSLYKR